jgi:hypothetical protein
VGESDDLNEHGHTQLWNEKDDNATIILQATSRGGDTFVPGLYIVQDLILTAIVEVADSGWTSRPVHTNRYIDSERELYSHLCNTSELYDYLVARNIESPMLPKHAAEVKCKLLVHTIDNNNNNNRN